MNTSRMGSKGRLHYFARNALLPKFRNAHIELHVHESILKPNMNGFGSITIKSILTYFIQKWKGNNITQ